MTVQEITKSRERLGLTQKKLSALINKSPQFINKLEHKKRILTPELKKQIRLALSNVCLRKANMTKKPAKRTTKKVMTRGKKR